MNRIKSNRMNNKAIGSKFYVIVGFVSTLYLIFGGPILAADPEDQARATLGHLNDAVRSKDIDSISRLLSDDCVVMMTNPAEGISGTRFFAKRAYLDLLKERFSKIGPSTSTQTVRRVITSETGEVFVAVEAESRTKIDHRSEWIRSNDYIIIKSVGDYSVIRQIVTEVALYCPNVPPDPTD